METPTPSTAKKPSLRNKVEAILFAVGKRISLQDICKLAKAREDQVKPILLDLKSHYENGDSSLVLVEEGDHWKLSIRDHYIPVVRKIVTETDLSKTVLETLAVIAFKYPIKQSDLIHIRTNKAYDHLKELEGQGFISRKKHGRTNLIKLTEKFFHYFDLPEDKLKQHFVDFESIAQAIVKKEQESADRKVQRAKELEEIKSTEDRIKKEIENLDVEPVKVKTYQTSGESKDENKETVGDLEVFDSGRKAEEEQKKMGDLEVFEDSAEVKEVPHHPPQREEKQEESAAEHSTPQPARPHHPRRKKETPVAEQASVKPVTPRDKTEEGIVMTPELEQAVNKKVDELLHGKKKPFEQRDDEQEDAQNSENT